MKRKLFRSLGILLCIAVLALTVANPAESRRARMYPVDIAAMGDLVIVGKLLAAEGKVDPQTRIMYTDVIVEVVQVIRNVTDQEVKVGSTINFRQIGGEIGDRKLAMDRVLEALKVPKVSKVSKVPKVCCFGGRFKLHTKTEC